jgi:hypothetical protein
VKDLDWSGCDMFAGTVVEGLRKNMRNQRHDGR